MAMKAYAILEVKLSPYWPSKIHNGLVNPIVAWLNPEVKVKPRSQLINKLIVACSGTTLILTFVQPLWPSAFVLRPIWLPLVQIPRPTTTSNHKHIIINQQSLITFHYLFDIKLKQVFFMEHLLY